MKIRRSILSAVLLGLLLILSACGTPPQTVKTGEDLWTEARFGAYTQQLGRNASLTVQGQSNEALSALAAIPSGGPVSSLSALANPDSLNDPSAVTSLLQGLSVAGLSNYSGLAPANNSGAIKLPRGVFAFDGSTWKMTGSSPTNLILTFPFANLDGTTSKVTIDIYWNKYKDTTVVTDGTLSYEVPRGLQLRSYVDINGDKSKSKTGFIDIYADWYKSTCGTTLLEPSKLAIKGEFGYQGAINVQFEVNIKKSQKGQELQAAYFGNNTAIESDGFVKVNAGKDSGKVFWDNIFYATISRAGNCTITDLKLDQGEIDFGATFTIGGQTTTAQLRFEFSNIKIGADLATSSVDLDGKIKVDGQVVVLSEGTLDASGQNLKLTFADGTLTLAEFIQKFLGDVQIDLGNLPLPTLP
jgi:hypothetical protein